MTDDEWRKIPQHARPYNAYTQPRYIEPGCDHRGPYCKCDPPLWLREPTDEERRMSRTPK